MKDVQVAIGTGGWEHEVFDTCLFPVPGMSPAEKLHSYAQYFDTVEVRATFWDDTLDANDARTWREAVSGNRRFTFNVKLHSSFTHKLELHSHRTVRVRGVLQELARADRLGALLLQFPYSFTNTGKNRFHLIKLSQIFGGFPMAVEFRHASWDEKGTRGLLEESGLTPANADLPRIRQMMPFTTWTSGKAAYIRLHGRNEKGWAVNALDGRYDYLYNQRELRELARRVQVLMSKGCDRITVVFNNTTRGGAIANAIQLAEITSGEKRQVPERVRAAFPQLWPATTGSDPLLPLVGEPLPLHQPYRQVV